MKQGNCQSYLPN